MPYTEFHYTPTGTGVISGKEVLEQTEDAINDLGGQISGDVQTAIDTANNALNVANTASTDAQNAVNTANTAYTAATNAQNTANTAQNTASNALTAAQNAQNDVNALGNRVTTAENNITQNTSDISGLTTRMGTAEGNITNLQNDVITAQGTATSAQNTATLAREQAYVTRYTNTAVSDNSTVAYSDLNNTDNIKIGDFILDVNGKLFAITAVDTSNETVSVTTPLTQLAVDSGVLHKSGNETKSGELTLNDTLNTSNIIPNSNLTYNLGTSDDKWDNVYANKYYYGSNATEFSNKFVTTDTNQTVSGTKTFSDGMALNSVLHFTNTLVTKGTIPQSTVNPYRIYFGSGINHANSLFNIDTTVSNTGAQLLTLRSAENVVNGDDTRFIIVYDPNLTQPRCIRFKGDCVPSTDNTYECGTNNNKWKSFNGLEPSALGMPDLDNGVDISSYITTGNTDNNYTPPANGWIWIRLIGNGASIIQGDFGINSSYVTHNPTNEKWVETNLFVTKDVQATIRCRNITGILSAKFYPCLGNV